MCDRVLKERRIRRERTREPQQEQEHSSCNSTVRFELLSATDARVLASRYRVSHQPHTTTTTWAVKYKLLQLHTHTHLPLSYLPAALQVERKSSLFFFLSFFFKKTWELRLHTIKWLGYYVALEFSCCCCCCCCCSGWIFLKYEEERGSSRAPPLAQQSSSALVSLQEVSTQSGLRRQLVADVMCICGSSPPPPHKVLLSPPPHQERERDSSHLLIPSCLRAAAAVYSVCVCVSWVKIPFYNVNLIGANMRITVFPLYVINSLSRRYLSFEEIFCLSQLLGGWTFSRALKRYHFNCIVDIVSPLDIKQHSAGLSDCERERTLCTRTIVSKWLYNESSCKQRYRPQYRL